MGKIKTDNKTGKIIIFLITIVLMIHTSSTSFANETILTTTVPSHFDIYIEITGQGTVAIGEQQYTENGVMHTERNKVIEIDFMPDENFYIEVI